MSHSKLDPRLLAEEVAGAPLGDPRRNRRHQHVVAAIASSPGASLPDVFDDDSELEGTYRLLGDKHVEFEALYEPHVLRTEERASQVALVYGVSDTTDFTFSGSSRQIGIRQGQQQGFRGHFCLAVAVTANKKPLPLGVLGVKPIFRDEVTPGKQARAAGPEDNEGLRWKQLALTVEERRAGRYQLVHVTDREGDIYDFAAGLVTRGARFIIRVAHDRLTEKEGRLFEQLKDAPVVLEQEVSVSARGVSQLPKQRKSHPARTARLAKLQVKATKATIRNPNAPGQSLTLNYVHVFEPAPPVDEEPIDWKLMTTESIDTPEQVEAVILGYRMRWVIEEFFKALKTGCGYEKNQLESRRAVLNYLAILLPIAWQLLLLRGVAQDEPGAPADSVLPRLLLTVLRAVGRRPLSPSPTAQEALFAIAGMGGHIKNNGPPGWLVLGRGFQKLLLIAEGWAARESSETSDQS